MIELRYNTSGLAAQFAELGSKITRIMADELRTAGGEVVAEMKRTWPRKTGRSAEGFELVSIPLGGRLQNLVPYVPYVHRRGTPTLALDELTAPAVETAIRAVPERAAKAAERRLNAR